MVRSREATEKYYPEMLSSWSNCQGGCLPVLSGAVGHYEIADYLHPFNQENVLISKNHAVPANEELLFAA